MKRSTYKLGDERHWAEMSLVTEIKASEYTWYGVFSLAHFHHPEKGVKVMQRTLGP